MTEPEWFDCSDSSLMLWVVSDGSDPMNGPNPIPVSDRKLRLFACACLRWSWRGLTADGSRENVERAERIVEGEEQPIPTFIDDPTSKDHMAICGKNAIETAIFGMMYSGNLFTDRATRVTLLRDIVGNPFCPVTLPMDIICDACDGAGGWGSSAGKRGGPGGQMLTACRPCQGEGRRCSWLTPTVLKLAQAAYDNRRENGHLDNDRLAILSDALGEAGCEDEWILNHLRGFSPHFKDDRLVCWNRSHELVHVRGCHVLDLILGKI